MGLTTVRSPAAKVEHRHYTRAPIVEAIVQLSFDEGAASPDALERSEAHFRQEFAVRKPLFSYEHRIQLTPESVQTPPAIVTPAGVQLAQANGKYLLRLAPNAVSIHETSQAGVYGGWKGFSSVARRVCDRFIKEAGVESVTRIGVRYLNRVDIPISTEDLRDWIVSLPDIPRGLPQLLSAFSSQITMPQPDLHGDVVAVVRQAILAQVQADSVPVLLDIDVVSNASTAIANYWDTIESLHEREHLVFECSITDNVRSVIE